MHASLWALTTIRHTDGEIVAATAGNPYEMPMVLPGQATAVVPGRGRFPGVCRSWEAKLA